MICIPVNAATNEEARMKMERYRAAAECIELRLDFIENPDPGVLLAAKDCPVLVTNRKKEEGGSFSGTEEERAAILTEAARRGADYLDIELSTGRARITEVMRVIQRCDNKTKLMVSHHDFELTPPEEVLRGIIDDAVNCGADMVKLATFARETDDNLRILGTIGYGRKRGVAITALCMGERGRISRVMAPFFGSFFSFAAGEEGMETAPGQLTVDEMKSVLRIVKP